MWFLLEILQLKRVIYVYIYIYSNNVLNICLYLSIIAA